MSSRSTQIKDKNDVVAENDDISKGQIGTDTLHSRIHNGEVFAVDQAELALADDGVIELLIRPTASEEAHLRFAVRSGGDATIELFESPTTTADGTPLTPRNHNRHFADDSDISFFRTPTVTADGTSLRSIVVPGGSGGVAQGGAAPETVEWVLEDGKDYLLRAKNIAGVTKAVGLEVDYYEILELA